MADAKAVQNVNGKKGIAVATKDGGAMVTLAGGDTRYYTASQVKKFLRFS